MRARLPDQDGFIERDGVKVGYETFGEGERTLLFLPTWTMIHSRCWKAQVPYFARQVRVVTFDARAAGAPTTWRIPRCTTSGRPRATP